MLQELKIKIRSAYLCDSKMLNVAVYVTKTATIIFLLVVFNFDFCASGAVVCIAHGRLMSFSCIHTKQVFCWRWQNSGFSQNLNSFHQHGWLVTGSVASVSCCFVTDWKLRHFCPVPGSIIKLLPDQFCDCIGSLSRLQDYFFISSLSHLWGSIDKLNSLFAVTALWWDTAPDTFKCT